VKHDIFYLYYIDTIRPQDVITFDFTGTEMDYFSRKSLSKYLMNTIDFNKRDKEIFINDMWQKYAGNIG